MSLELNWKASGRDRIDTKLNINYEIRTGDRCVITEFGSLVFANQAATVVGRSKRREYRFITDDGESFELGPSQGSTSEWVVWLPEQLNKFEE